MSRPRQLALVVVLVYIVLTWWTGRYTVPAPTPLSESSVPNAVRPTESTIPPPAVPPPHPASGPPTPAPRAGDQDPLAAIRGLIPVDLDAAEHRLQSLAAGSLSDPGMQDAVAGLWAHVGIARANARGPAAGVPALKSALAIAPAHRAANVTLVKLYWESKDPALTPDYVERVIALSPEHPLPHLVLADVLYSRDELGQSVQHLDMAKRLGAEDPDMRALIERVSARVQRLEHAERGFVARTSTHFRVKFDGEENYDIWNRVLDILEEAYRDVGQQLGRFPRKSILVVLHTRGTFQAATGSPAWADGLFDPIEGRIKIPTQGALTDQEWLTSVLRHEYVHAALHEWMDGRVGAVPQWLNEGLAMELSASKIPEIRQLARGPVRLIALNDLEGTWSRLPADAALVAYVEGKSATRYMIERYGMDRVQHVLSALAAGQSSAEAFETGLLITYPDFQRRWVEDLNSRISTGSS